MGIFVFGPTIWQHNQKVKITVGSRIAPSATAKEPNRARLQVSYQTIPQKGGGGIFTPERSNRGILSKAQQASKFSVTFRAKDLGHIL
jgi:hypothetical protein